MNVQSEHIDSIRRYLLGELSEEECEQVERRLMTEDDLYQQLLIAEDDLIDEYVSDKLPEQERAKFGHFLSVPELRQDVRFAAALRKQTLKAASQAKIEAAPREPRASPLTWLRAFFMRPAFGASLAAALLAALLLAAWLATQNSRLRQQVEQLQAVQAPPPSAPQELQERLAAERLRNEELAALLSRMREQASQNPREPREPQPTPTRGTAPRPASESFLALTLTPGLSRDSGQWKKFSLRPGIREVRLSLELPEGVYASYGITLKTVEGREILQRQGLRPAAGKVVPLVIPARLLSPDDYQVHLNGVSVSGEAEEVSRYHFRVLR